MKAFRFLLPAAAGIIPFLLYGFTLTTCTVFCICCILSVAFLIKGIDEDYGSQIVSLKSYILLLLVGVVSLVTLYKLYNPSKEVFTNADHHILTFNGYHAETNKVLLFGNPDQNPIWSNEELGGKVEMTLQEDKSLILNYESLLQPLYMQIPNTSGGIGKYLNKITGKKTDNEKYHEELVNKDRLPKFVKTFTLTLHNNLGIGIEIDDRHRKDRTLEVIQNKIEPKRSDSCVVKVQFLQDNQKIGDSIQGGYTKLIRRSLALSDIIRDIPIPEGADFDWSLLNGITVLREKPAKKDEYVDQDTFHLAFTPQALDSLKLLEAGGETYTRERLLSEAKGSHTIEYKEKDLAIHVGSGMETTPAVIYDVEGSNLFVKMNAPQRQYLPMDREVIDQPQTFVITSSLIGLASSETTSALHYPILKNFGEQEQFKLAVEYLPEHTSVPLTCKIQSLGRDQLSIEQDGTITETNRITADNRLILTNKNRNLSPVFTFENLRDSQSVPFTSQRGYWLILTALICAGISFVAGRDRFESRGEVIVWMGLIALLTYRAFIAWRTSVFPPLDNFSLSRWTDYQKIDYTFKLTLICIIALSLCWSLYKLFHHKKENCYRWLENRSAWILPGVTLGVIVCGFGAYIITERLTYVFFPILSFIAMEWIFQHKRHEEEIDFRWHCLRYISMLISLAIPLVTDAGFGIVFALFLFLYNALENFYQAQTEFHETGVGMNKYTILMFIFLLLFSGLLFGGIHVLSFLFAHFYVFAAIFVGVMALLAFLYFCKAKQACEEEEFSKGWIYAPLIGIALVSLLFVGKGKDYLDGHKHLLYRAEVHLKNVDEIMLENEVESSDLNRLFQASQNRWYLGYYMDERGWEKAVPFDYKPYDLRSHFNKGITWDTQKTDAVLGRYVIGEHSLMTVYSLIALFFAIFVGIFVINRRREQFRLLGTGVTLLLACQAIFITLAVTNRFIFFGQDYPLVSQHSMLTLALTFTALLVIGLSSQREEFADDLDSGDARTSTILVSGLIGLFALSWIFNYILPTKGSEDFNVAAALREADDDLERINEKLIKFQNEYREEIAKRKMLVNFKTKEEIMVEQKKNKVFKPRQIQTNYHEFIDFFNKKNPEIVKMKKKPAEGTKKDSFSLFTQSLYQTYIKKLAKNNSSTDIIHLRTVNKQGNKEDSIESGTYVEFNTNGGFYRLTTPETTEKSWRGNIVPQGQMAKRSNLSIQENGKNVTANQPQNSGKIIDRDGLYLAKVDPNWTVGNKNYYIIGAVKEYATIKSGTNEYELKKSKKSPQYYMNVQTDDYIKVGNIHISNKGDEGRYFARNLLVNGKRTMIYPLGKKFFYPYHLAQLANDTAALSGEDVVKRNKDIQLTLSYTLTDTLFNILQDYSPEKKKDPRRSKPKARSIIVADGNGHIKAMVTTKNEKGYHSGFEYVDPNDEIEIAKKANQFYLNGDYISEERTFGDLNFARLNLGPGSSMKPLTFTSVMSQAYYDWSKLRLYIATNDLDRQGLKHVGSDVTVKNYVDIKSPINESLYNDERGDTNGYTDIARYMEKSSNFYNSLMVFMGFYKRDYLAEALKRGSSSDLFERYERATNKFPAFTLGNQKYVFKKWVGNDGMDNHQDGALQVGLKDNFGLWFADPDKTESDLDIEQRLISRNIYDPELFHYSGSSYSEMKNKGKFCSRHAFAFPRFSFLPENMRIGSKQNYKDALTGTTLGGNLFQVTPLKMAEMYGKLFSQNRAYSLTLNPNYKQSYAPFVRAQEYERGGVYENILSNHLFKGMSKVTESGTAVALASITKEIKEAGYHIYAKTGTIGMQGNKNIQSGLLGVVISKNKLDDLDAESFNKTIKNNRFYVMYFLTEESKHYWKMISDVLETIYNSSEFQQYMAGEDNTKNN
ncbi:MAG: hypothetical protein IJ417_04435 [Bacteroidaceae bacterium]|nr:hypothetical protein [Bacteroidaceae bacterium]